MLSDAIKIAELISNVFKERDKKNKQVYTTYISPIYEQMKLVHADYQESFRLLAGMSGSRFNRGDFRDFILTKKLDLEPIRDSLRVYSEEYRNMAAIVSWDPILAEFLEKCATYLRGFDEGFGGEYPTIYRRLLGMSWNEVVSDEDLNMYVEMASQQIEKSSLELSRAHARAHLQFGA